MRAWKLVQLMNRVFREPLVQMERGGAERGHAALTSAGRDVLDAYREMDRAGSVAARRAFGRIRRHLRP